MHKQIPSATGVPRVQRSLYFPVDLLEDIAEKAKTERRSFNQQVIYMLENLLTEKNTKAARIFTHASSSHNR